MKRLTIILALIFAFSACVCVFASGADLTIDELSLDKSSYKKGETATITFAYNVPYEGVSSASASFDTKGLSGMKIASARTLVCDDVSCNMHSEADFLSFSGRKLRLGAGYSGTVTFTATVENAENVSVKCKLSDGNGSVQKSAKAKVSDYTAPTPKPTATPKPTPKATAKPTPKATAKPTPKATHRPRSTQKPTATQKPVKTAEDDEAKTPVTGSASYAAAAFISVLCGGAVIGAARRKRK